MRKRMIVFVFLLLLIVGSLFCPAMAMASGNTPVASGTYAGHTYDVYDVSMTWPDAKAYCEALGGHLVTITSESEQQFVADLIDGHAKKQYWIGLSYPSGTMEWVTGETFSYANWEVREPNHGQRTDAQYEEYIQIYNVANVPSSLDDYEDYRFTWNDIYYDNTLPGQEEFFSLEYVGFICERESTPPVGNFMEVVNSQVTDNAFTFEIRLNSEINGYVFAVVYNHSGKMKSATMYPAMSTVSVTLYEAQETDYAKIIWIDEYFAPICEAIALESISPHLYVSPPMADCIATDDDTGMQFVSNELIVYAKIGAKRDDVISLLNNCGGTVVGEISATDTYQVRFSQKYAYSDILSLCSELEQNDLIEWVSENSVFQSASAYYPVTDSLWTGEWDDYKASGTSSGLNWGMEAIHAPEAWDYREHMGYVNVGIYDCCFCNNEDLVYAKTIGNNVIQCYNECFHVPGANYQHGTHVSGIIGAGFDNHRGVTGVAPYVNLYGYSYKGPYLSIEPDPIKTTRLQQELAITQLVHYNKCRVLNFSIGIVFPEKDTNKPEEEKIRRSAALWADLGDSRYILDLTQEAEEIGIYLKRRLIDLHHDDFVICTAAGNDNNSIINPNATRSANAKYSNFFTAIDATQNPELQEVEDRIIVVGACGNSNGAYYYSDFANIGNRVDVVAPGEDILSTVDADSYALMDGTSMASPHVAGIAAMLYGIDSTLTGSEVKDIITRTATTNVGGCSYKMVNAQLAVETALRNKNLLKVKYLYNAGTSYVSLGLPNPNGNWGAPVPVEFLDDGILMNQDNANSSWVLCGVSTNDYVNTKGFKKLCISYDVITPMVAYNKDGSKISRRGIMEISSSRGFRNNFRQDPKARTWYDIDTVGHYTRELDISEYSGNYYFTILIYTGHGDGDRYSQFASIKVREIYLSE